MKAKDIAIGAGLGLAGVAVLFGTRRAAKRRAAAKKPSVVCPASPVADTSELASGDFVAITLRSADRKLKVATWALVIATGLGAGRDVRVRLVGEFGLAGVRILPPELGFRLGDQLTIGRRCIFEVYRPATSGVVLCGQWLVDVAHSAAIATPDLLAGDDVQIWLAPADPGNPQMPGPGYDVLDPVWATVVRVSAACHVVRVRLLDAPGNTGGHGSAQGAELDITRECITDRRRRR